MGKKVVVAGGTGLIGQFLLDQLQADPAYDTIHAFARKKPADSRNKVHWIIADFDDEPALRGAITGADAVFCCLGTTIKKAGSQEAFRKVDHDYVFNLAKATKAAGCEKFLVVSAIGSDPKSRIFYSRVKGEMESAIRGLAIPDTVVFQPSMLEGPRTEKRLGERIGILLGKIVAPIMAGELKKYRLIHVRDVANAMVRESKKQKREFRTLTYDEMIEA